MHYVPTGIERSKSITTQYLRTAIHLSGQILSISKSWCLPISYFLVVMPLTSNLVKKDPNFYMCSNGDKRIKTTIYRNVEANILSSKYRFHKFWNHNPSSDAITAKIWSKKAQICISCAKGDRKIKKIPKWSQTDISNTICGRRIKTTITHKIFDTNSSFPVRKRTVGKI